MIHKPHIVFYSAAYLHRGGIERNLLQVVELLSTEYRFSLVGAFTDYFKEQMEQAGVTCYFQPIPPSFSWQAIRKLARFLKEIEADLIHTIEPRGSTIGAPAGRLARIPTVHRHSVSPLDYTSSRLKKVLYGVGEALLGWTGIDASIFVAEKVMQFYTSYKMTPLKRSYYIPNSVDQEEYKHIKQTSHREKWNLEAENFLWVNLGRLEYQKAQDVLILAASQLPQNYAWQIWIVGEGSLQEQLALQIEKLDLQHRVKLLGSLPHREVLSLLAIADGLVFPSRFENMPNAVLEAMTLQVPAIVTDVGDSWWMSGLGNLPPASLLVSPDDPVMLAQAMQRLMNEPALRKALSAAGEARIAGFTVARTIRETAQIYKRLLKKE